MYSIRLTQLEAERKRGVKIIGTLCLFVPDEIIFSAGADRIILCGGKADTIPRAEEFLPRNICPLVKSSFGAIIDACCGGQIACSHVSLVDIIVAEATCDAKKKTYELLPEYRKTYVLDLPQRPNTPEAKDYFLSELKKFGMFMDTVTGHSITTDALRREIQSANETRKLLHRLYDLRKRDPPPIRGSEILRVMQRQFFLSPAQFQEGIRQICDELETRVLDIESKPRILLSGCPNAAGNTKVPDIIEQKGGIIVAEESCTGTRAFWDLVDEEKDPWVGLAERYLEIPCACMTPNEQRITRIKDLVTDYNVDGVVYSTLQFCHPYAIEKFRVQHALKKMKVPMLAIESDYGDADIEQIGIRVEAFLEMLS
ncbi:MAG: 2-hydroxyacyl-CoA dehydratase family protein [Methanomicrobiales archaeon]|nr:2-hydroxyacyl-CoA dehydratase family protein [Methanomicrobiales archaeon]